MMMKMSVLAILGVGHGKQVAGAQTLGEVSWWLMTGKDTLFMTRVLTADSCVGLRTKSWQGLTSNPERGNYVLQNCCVEFLRLP